MERYKLEIVNDQGESYIRGEPAPDGSWVMFKDVAALEARADRNAAGYARVDAEARRAEFLHKQKLAALQRRIAELEAALRPFSEMFLYPDDLGFEVAEDIKSDPEWCSDANDLQDENLFVLRGDIRKARAALGDGKKDG